MSWRTIVISSRCKLDLKLGYMVIRGAETKNYSYADCLLPVCRGA